MTAPGVKHPQQSAAAGEQPAKAGVPMAPMSPIESSILGTYKRAPVEFVRGSGVRLFDAEGKGYIDFVSGIATNALGYDDPGLKAALHAAA